MGTFFGNIFGVILILAFIVGFILFLQLMSKLSGKNIKQKYGSGTIRPDDFDTSIKLIKNTKEELNFKIKTFGLSKFEKTILKFEKILNSTSNYKYSNYCLKIEQYSKLKEKEDKDNAELSRILRGEKRDEIPNIFETPMSLSEKARMHKLEYEINSFNRYFQNEDISRLINFISPALQNDNNKILRFIDLLGCENFKPFNEVVIELEKCFLKNEINKQEINNIKKLILINKGLLDNII
jgi:hypothetical protein